MAWFHAGKDQYAGVIKMVADGLMPNKGRVINGVIFNVTTVQFELFRIMWMALQPEN